MKEMDGQFFLLAYWLQKHSFAYMLENRCSKTFHKFRKKTPVLEPLFNKVAGPQIFAAKQLNIQCYNNNFGL